MRRKVSYHRSAALPQQRASGAVDGFPSPTDSRGSSRAKNIAAHGIAFYLARHKMGCTLPVDLAFFDAHRHRTTVQKKLRVRLRVPKKGSLNFPNNIKSLSGRYASAP